MSLHFLLYEPLSKDVLLFVDNIFRFTQAGSEAPAGLTPFFDDFRVVGFGVLGSWVVGGFCWQMYLGTQCGAGMHFLALCFY